MKTWLIYVLLTTAVALATMSTTGTPQISGHTFRVALRYVPTNLDPRHNQLNTTHYVLLHLYYPLFEKSESGLLDSHFLDVTRTKSLDSSFESFQFCLKSDIRFNDRTTVSINDLRRALIESHRTQEVLPPLSSLENHYSMPDCLIATIDHPDLSYFDKFQGVASTVLKSGTEQYPFPIGLGPYRVRETSTEKLTLELTSPAQTGQINQIEFLKFNTIEEAETARIDDWNHIYQIEIPARVREYSQSIPSPMIKVYAVVINVKNPLLRKQITNCLSRETLVEALELSLEATKGFLPTGVMGADIDTATSAQVNCRPGGRSERIEFLTSKKNEIEPLKNLVSNKTPIWIEPHFAPPEEMVRRVYSKSPYLAVIGFDSSGSQESTLGESSIYFESFIRDQRLIAEPPKGLHEAIMNAAKANLRTEKIELYRKAHKILLDSGYVLPLGQLKSKQYYPKSLTQIQWADRISGFPQLDRARIIP